MQKKFRKAFISQSSKYDFHPITELCNEVVFITNGYETDTRMLEKIQQSLKDFDPALDLLVPVGPVGVNLLVGMVIEAEHSSAKNIAIALYRNKQYEILYVKN